MSTGTIVAQDWMTDTLVHEAECLAAHIFAETYLMTWEAATDEALACLSEVLFYAAEWDDEVQELEADAAMQVAA